MDFEKEQVFKIQTDKDLLYNMLDIVIKKNTLFQAPRPGLAKAGWEGAQMKGVVGTASCSGLTIS